jgi:hypothetical protein
VLFTIGLASADAGGPYSVDEGGCVELSATSDPLGADFTWDLDGDGDYDDGFGPTVDFDATGLDGPDDVTVWVKAAYTSGLSAEASATVTVLNVAPTVDAGGDASLFEGETLTQAGSFSDPGADLWTGTVDWGEGAGPEPLPLAGTTFSLNHLYASAGEFDVTVEITDDDGGVGTDVFHVSVAYVPTLEGLQKKVDDLADSGALSPIQEWILDSLLAATRWLLAQGQPAAAAFTLEVFAFQVEWWIGTGQLTEEEGRPLVDDARAIAAGLTG